MARIDIDVRRWPLVVFRVPETLSAEDVTAHFERIEAEVFKRGRYASLMDARLTDPYRFSADLRRHAATLYREHTSLFSRLLISEAYVLESSVQRGVLTAIRWLAPAPWPTKNFARFEDAAGWTIENIAREPSAPSIPPFKQEDVVSAYGNIAEE